MDLVKETVPVSSEITNAMEKAITLAPVVLWEAFADMGKTKRAAHLELWGDIS